MTLEENIRARKAAEEIVSLVEGEGERFWIELDRMIRPRLPSPKGKPRVVESMTDVEAIQFGRQLMPFGEFEGRRVEDVPLDRLEWYADTDFVDRLRRYLGSVRVKGERCETD